ncbi:MAG: Uma2 family endonuclease [Labilithrix sp.]|nr:Uma2 family endonuclease [Labilithrix sp.]MCW5815116.1 Uma2 family endonuclease [Labilithrix sp.]
MLAHDLAHARPRRIRRAEYDRMAQLGFFRGERVELIRGTVVAMSPIGPPHSSVVDRLTRLLVRALDPRALVRIQQPFLAHDESEPEPDVAVVPDGLYADAHPDRAFLIIEVAESSLDYEREAKAPLYAASGVDEYWIVDVAARSIEVYSHPVNGRYRSLRTVDEDGSVTIAAFPDVTIEVATLFA